VALPLDAIVPIYYSASVNIASTNSQSLQPAMAPLLLIQQGAYLKNIDKRLFQKLDTIFQTVPGTNEVIAIYESLLHKVIPKIAADNVSIGAGSILRKALPKITTGNVVISEAIRVLRSLSRALSETAIVIQGNVVETPAKVVSEVAVAISDLITMKAIPYIAETIGISDMIGAIKARLFLHFNEPAITVSDGVNRVLKAVRTMIEGKCSILFSGLGPE